MLCGAAWLLGMLGGLAVERWRGAGVAVVPQAIAVPAPLAAPSSAAESTPTKPMRRRHARGATPTRRSARPASVHVEQSWNSARTVMAQRRARTTLAVGLGMVSLLKRATGRSTGYRVAADVDDSRDVERQRLRGASPWCTATTTPKVNRWSATGRVAGRRNSVSWARSRNRSLRRFGRVSIPRPASGCGPGDADRLSVDGGDPDRGRHRLHALSPEVCLHRGGTGRG